MDIDLAVLVLREANVVLGGAAFFWLLMKANKHWGEYSLPIKAYSMSLMLFAFSTIYTSAEMIAQDTPSGFKSLFILAANLSLAWALWMMRGRHTFGESERRGRGR